MRKFLLLLTVLALNTVNAQTIKQMSKIFKTDFIQLNNTSNYANLITENIQFDSSLTRKGDTTGAHNKREYLMFHDAIVTENKTEVLKLLRTNWVSNAEYDLFCKSVLDSIKRERIYANSKNEINVSYLAWMLIHDKRYKDINGQDSVFYNYDSTAFNRKLYPFNQNFWFSSNFEARYIPLLSDLYLSMEQRFYKKKEFNPKLWLFRRSKSDNEPILISRDREIWARKSEYVFDTDYNLANHYYRADEFKEAPVQGILGNQAQAYLIYLEDYYQKKINQKKLPYKINLTLPAQRDLDEAYGNYNNNTEELAIKKQDMTAHWQITNADYAKFIAATRDSIIREVIYERYGLNKELEIDEETRAKSLNNLEVYYDEVELEWREFDPSEPYKNRELFFFDYDYNWVKKIDQKKYLPLINEFFRVDDSQTELDYSKLDVRKYRYRFYWQDLKRRAKIGNFSWNDMYKRYELVDPSDRTWDARMKDMGNGIRRPASYGTSIIEEDLSIYPSITCAYCNKICEHTHGDEFHTEEEFQAACDKCPVDFDNLDVPVYDFETSPNELAKGLTYLQALAFYHWKFLNKAPHVDFEEVIYNELLPSEEEFYKIQAGESIIKPAQKIEYPTPLFRYVVNVYAQ